MRKIIIENVDLMSEDEEKELKEALKELNCGFIEEGIMEIDEIKRVVNSNQFHNKIVYCLESNFKVNNSIACIADYIKLTILDEVKSTLEFKRLKEVLK